MFDFNTSGAPSMVHLPNPKKHDIMMRLIDSQKTFEGK